MSVGLRPYAVTVASVAGATLVAIALRTPLQAAVAPLFLAAVVIACAYGGRRSGLVATGLALVASEAILDMPSSVRAGAFAGAALLAVSLYGRALDTRDRAEALARAREDLVRREQAARADAETAGRARDEFLAALSHELRTPLNALMGWLWWLRRGDLDADRQTRALETIERNTATLAQLVEDLLDVSRIIGGKLRLSAREVDATAIVTAAVDSMRPSAAAKSIAIGVAVDAGLDPVVADPERLRQIVCNLLSNAIRFTPEHGHVDVGLHRASSSLVIEVRDSGAGIPAALLPHVFDRFRPVDVRRPTTGLGLSVVRQLAHMHGGTVRAESPGEGRGATFTVTLPLGEATAGPERVPPPRGPRLDNLRVLVVEDDADARLWLKAGLERLGAAVLIAASVEAALEMFEREAPDVLVSDIRLPDGDGYVLLEHVRAVDDARGRRTPAIALTAYPRVEDRARALQAGFSVHVSKPVTPDALASVIVSLADSGDHVP